MQTELTALSSLVSVMGLWCMIAWLYRDYRIDKFRQSAFALRDELFDYAYAGQLPFDHPAYGLLRSLMNGFIRFSHRLTFSQLIVSELLVADAPGVPFHTRWTHAIDDLPEETRHAVNCYLHRLNHLAIEHIVLGSALSLPLTFVLLPLAMVFAVRKAIAAAVGAAVDRLAGLRRRIEEIDTIAVTLGEAA